jgi:hypothetical protein
MLVKVKSGAAANLKWHPQGEITADVHGVAESKGKSVTSYFEDIKTEQSGQASPYAGMTLLEITKKRMTDPNSPMTAVEEYMKAAGINPRHDTVSKFFDYSDTSVIFPEYWKAQVCMGQLKAGLTQNLVMMVNTITSSNYHKLYLESTETERQLRKTSPGGTFQKTRMSVSEQSINIPKFGRLLEVPYETIAQQRLPVFAAALQKIGMQIEIDKTNEALYVLVNGDGNSNTPGKTGNGDITNTDKLFEMFTKLDMPYKIDTLIMRKADMVSYLVTISQFSNPQNQFAFMPLVPPKWFEWDDATALSATSILGIDSRYALEEVNTGDILVETDKIISRQINQTVISQAVGYSVFDKEAVCLWTNA